MSNGFIPIRRSLFRHFLFKESRIFSRFEAWLDLIQMASFTDENTELINGKLITRDKGEVVASLRYLSERWNWSRHKVSDYLELLRSQDMVVVDKGEGLTKILLKNFEQHNRVEEPDSAGNRKRNSKSRNRTAFPENQGTVIEPPQGTLTGQRGDSEGTNINKDNKGNKEETHSFGADAPVYVDEEMFQAFQTWVLKNTPRVAQLKEPFTLEQYKKLRDKFPREVVQKVLFAMQNRADLLKKYVSAYLTANDWAKREMKTKATDEQQIINTTNEKLKAAGAKGP